MGGRWGRDVLDWRTGGVREVVRVFWALALAGIVTVPVAGSTIGTGQVMAFVGALRASDVSDTAGAASGLVFAVLCQMTEVVAAVARTD